MNLRSSLILIFILSLMAGPAAGLGFIPGLLECDRLPASAYSNGFETLNSSSFDNPANIQTDSTNITLEYNAENLIRTKKNGKLTADITSNGKIGSLFIPLHTAEKNTTTFAICNAVSDASAYYKNSDTETMLTFKTDTSAWAVNHSFGKTRLGLMGSQYSSLIPGTSTYPQSIFSVFSGWTPVKFDLDGKDTLVQVVRPISGSSEVCVTAGTGNSSLHILFGEGNNRISIPAGADTAQYGIDVNKKLNTKLNMDLGYLCSTGSGSNLIYRNDSKAGRLEYEPDYSRISTSISYQKRPGSVWKAGYVSDRWDLNLQGHNLLGEELGIDIKPFNEKIDLDADVELTINYFYLGMQRRTSDKWQLGWRYKYGSIGSNLNSDYIGRAFWGLVSVSGSYDEMLLSSQFHDLELSARYQYKATSFEIKIEQIVPMSSDHSNSVHRPDNDHGKSTGGTSLSFTSNYAF